MPFPPAPPKSEIGRNQFRCFHCRLVFAQKDGDWVDWDQQQVHLCRRCDQLTADRAERSNTKE